jgi:hypothetical protein
MAGAPIALFARMIDLATRGGIVNATSENKRVLFEWRGFGRRNAFAIGSKVKQSFPP